METVKSRAIGHQPIKCCAHCVEKSMSTEFMLHHLNSMAQGFATAIVGLRARRRPVGVAQSASPEPIDGVDSAPTRRRLGVIRWLADHSTTWSRLFFPRRRRCLFRSFLSSVESWPALPLRNWLLFSRLRLFRHRRSPGQPALQRVLSRFYGFHPVVPSCSHCSSHFLGITWFCCVWLVFARFYLDLLGFT